jgi:hypothetical protein
MAALPRMVGARLSLPPVLASAAVLRWADLEALLRRRSGRHVLTHMPPVAQGSAWPATR